MNIILFDGKTRNDLLPLTYTRPVAELRVGILKISEKWQNYLPAGKISFQTEDYLSVKYPKTERKVNVYINGSVLPNKELADKISELKTGESLLKGDLVIAAVLSAGTSFSEDNTADLKLKPYLKNVSQIAYPWDIFTLNEQEIEADFKLLTEGKSSQPISDTNRYRQAEHIFLEEGAKVEFAILNPAGGYIYIGKDAEIMEGAVVHGSLAMCEHSVLKLSAKIYGATTLGPYCKAGGEVNNSVFQAYSNKGHDGFLGNSVLGEWCNLGADTNNSNLKNNYAEVKVWNYPKGGFVKTGLQFCGLIMGDHSKSGINTMFNTGTVVGVSSNIFGSGFPRNFVPSFSWGGAGGFTTYRTKKAFETARIMMKRRHIEFNDIEADILSKVFELSENYRAK